MSPDQVLDLNDRANALSQEFNMDIVIVTTDDTGGKSQGNLLMITLIIMVMVLSKL